MRILLTGGAGFIGSHVADRFLAEGHTVTIVDDLSTGRRENVPAGAELHALDIRSAGVGEVFDKFRPEVLCHHAAQADVRRSVADPMFDADVNIVGTLRLLEHARRVGCRRVLFASTGGAIYGEQDVFPAPETHATRPVSPYGAAKNAIEIYLHYYAVEHGFESTCLRYANVYGPRQNPHGEAGVVAIFLDRLLAGKDATINGDGEQTRDYVYVGDVANANALALAHGLRGPYNVGTGVETSVNQLAHALRELVPGSPALVHGPAKSGEQKRSCLDASKLSQATGWRPTVAVPEGLAQTALWFREHRTKAG